MNTALYYIAKSLGNVIRSDVSSVSDLIKDSIDVDQLLNARMISQQNLSFYKNQKEMYVRVNFGNNVVLPFFIDANIATCLKTIKEKTDTESKLKGVTELKKVFELPSKADIYDVQQVIKDKYGFEIKVDEKEQHSFRVKKTTLGEAQEALKGSVWEASLKSFIGGVEKVAGQTELLASNCDALKDIKKISKMLAMIENKQKQILENSEMPENSFVQKTSSITKKFNSESIDSFLELLKKEKHPDSEILLSNQDKPSSVRMVGVFHLDEVIDISSELQSVLDMELSNKVSYKIKLSKEEPKEPEAKRQVVKESKELYPDEIIENSDSDEEEYDYDFSIPNY